VRPADPQKAVTGAAYNLFYRRRDLPEEGTFQEADLAALK